MFIMKCKFLCFSESKLILCPHLPHVNRDQLSVVISCCTYHTMWSFILTFLKNYAFFYFILKSFQKMNWFLVCSSFFDELQYLLHFLYFTTFDLTVSRVIGVVTSWFCLLPDRRAKSNWPKCPSKWPPYTMCFHWLNGNTDVMERYNRWQT